MNERCFRRGSWLLAVGALLLGCSLSLTPAMAQTGTEASAKSSAAADPPDKSESAPKRSEPPSKDQPTTDDTPENSAPYVLVIHADNPIEDLDRSRISKMFLKKIKRWPDKGKTPVEPIDQTEDSPIRAPFTRGIHNKDLFAIKTYWQRMIFSGRMAPPAELRSDEEVLSFVRSRRGAIGYVQRETPLGEGVKALRVIQDEK